MQKLNYLPFIISLFFVSILISCSSPSETARKSGGETGLANLYPAWYDQRSGIQSDDTRYFGYAAVLAVDSAHAEQKAITEAKNRLKASVSTRLESIRNEAASELGSNAGLDTPRFILALRKAEDEVTEVAEIESRAVRKNKKGAGYHGFAKAVADKGALIAALDQAFSVQGNVWTTMKESEAFQKF